MNAPAVTRPVFLPEHASAVLAYVTSVDSRFHEQSDTVAAARVRAWASILHDVEPAFALEYARRYYSKPQDQRITPAAIRSSWMGQVRREEARTRPRAPRGAPPPAGLADYLRQAVKVAQAGGDVAEVPLPAGVTPISAEQDHHLRRCANWRGCACDHLHCREGWLDAEDRVVSVHGQAYPAVKRCPHCHDAALMAAEAATPVRSHRR